MKYLLLDTNIYLDMLFSRTKLSPPETISRLDSLLKWGTARLIVPEIVVIETQRNINNLVCNIDINVRNMINLMEESYWINTEHELPKYKNTVKETVKSLREYKVRLDNNKENYIKGLNINVSSLFDMGTIIKTDNDLIASVQKRKLFKKAPLHTNKDSSQDALIVETLLNIKKYVDILPDDEIYFISKNYSDFSKSKSEIQTIHDDINNDLINAGLDGVVKYRNLLFRTLKDDFDVEYITANEIEDEYNEFLFSQEYDYVDAFAEEMDVLGEYPRH
ncbi:PIN domain-containing protein [Paenibacillus sp. TC-CSREp1]|uniref:PIN domain-containing protein n=1 Tax=Paenibacillus sp. TC-CSREp1 TaxID=3410089 RepID=UPI003CE6AAAF